MSDSNRHHYFLPDNLDGWVRDQQPPQPSSAFLEHCLATIPRAGAVSVQELAGDVFSVPAISVEARTADSVLHGPMGEMKRLKMKRRLRILGIGGLLATTVALFLVSNLWPSQSAAAQKAAEVLARGAEAASNPTTVHIVAKMRTPPGEYFEAIDADAAMVPVQVWRQFTDEQKWRIEKPGMVEVMDNSVDTLLEKPNRAWRYAIRHENVNPRDLMLLQLAGVQGLLDRELRAALANGWDLKLTHETMARGEKRLLVTVDAFRGWPENNYAKNKSFDSSDIRRVYRFDAKTHRLDGMDAYLHRRSGGDMLVLTVERIEYDQPIDPALFALKLPEDVKLVDWRKDYREPQVLPDNDKYSKMTPKQAARAFLEACAKEDWDEVRKFETGPLSEQFRKGYGRLEIVHIGEPFKVQTYFGWYIPYEIKLRTGGVKKWNLAMRNDNRAHRYVEDGGI